MRPNCVSEKMWNDFLFQSEHFISPIMVDCIYEALKEDLSESVMFLLSKIKHPTLLKEPKSESKSTEFRNKGNKAYANKKFQKALICYNKALLYAPSQSIALKLAYSNRSAVFIQCNFPAACIKDIDTCCAMGCPDNIKDKVSMRRIQANNLLKGQQLSSEIHKEQFLIKMFDFQRKNSKIPCCSSDIDVIIENDMPKIIASKNIKAGTVLAVEAAFISETETSNVYYSCQYCHKMALNLKPCEGCTYALFCDAQCEKLAFQEYHNVECAIGELDIPRAFDKMIFKAAIKIRNKCSSWEQFIDASNTMGEGRIKKSTFKEIFDENEKFSLLTFLEKRHFVYGPRVSASVLYAVLIRNLKEVSFFPTNNLEIPAIQAFARVLMYLNLYLPKSEKLPCVTNDKGHSMLHRNTNFGVFSFISKIRKTCPGNCITIDLNKKQALVAMFPITAGTELTTPFSDPWLTISPLDQFTLYNTVGGCKVCMENCSPPSFKYTEMQQDAMIHMGLLAMQAGEEYTSNNVLEIFKIACRYMTHFSSVPHTEEFKLLYGTFRKSLLFIQDKVTKNYVLDMVV